MTHTPDMTTHGPLTDAERDTLGLALGEAARRLDVVYAAADGSYVFASDGHRAHIVRTSTPEGEPDIGFGGALDIVLRFASGPRSSHVWNVPAFGPFPAAWYVGLAVTSTGLILGARIPGNMRRGDLYPLGSPEVRLGADGPSIPEPIGLDVRYLEDAVAHVAGPNRVVSLHVTPDPKDAVALTAGGLDIASARRIAIIMPRRL